MSIRFFCEKCNKPLEVDDTDAGGKVMCCYCQQAVNVPTSSAAELGGGEAASAVVSEKKQSSMMGVIGLVCGVVVILGLVGVFAWTMSSALLPMMRDEAFMKMSQVDQKKAMTEAVNAFIKQKPVLQMLPKVLLSISVVGVLLSLVSVVSNYGRKMGIAGLIICGGYSGLAILSFVMKMGK
jgi:hypothetical protein